MANVMERRLEVESALQGRNIGAFGSRTVSRRLWTAGWLSMAAGLTALGAIQTVFGIALPDLVKLDLRPEAARLSGLLLVGCGIAMLAKRHHVAAGTAASLLAILAAISFYAIAGSRSHSLPAWVPFAELLTLMMAAISGFRRPAGMIPLRACLGSALLLFGAIHLQYREAIGSMVPEWMPLAWAMPWITGPIQLAAGVALLAGRGTFAATIVIASLYISWLPLVHAPRLVADPTNPGEWTFATLALALAGCAMMAGGEPTGAPPARTR